MVGQVLLHTGAKAEMRAFPGENHNLELWSIPQVLEGRSQSCQHGLVDDVGFGRSQCNAGDLAIVFEGEFQAAHRPAFVVSRAAQGAISAINSSLQRTPSARRWRSRTKSTSRCCRVPQWKARKPALASVIMLSANQARVVSGLRSQCSSLCFLILSTVFVRQSGMVCRSFVLSPSTASSSNERSMVPFDIRAFPASRASPVFQSPTN